MRSAGGEGVLVILLSLLAAFQSPELFSAASRRAVMPCSTRRSAASIDTEMAPDDICFSRIGAQCGSEHEMMELASCGSLQHSGTHVEAAGD